MKKSKDDSEFWSLCWRNARNNMPRYYKNGRQGSATVLFMLIGGYKYGAPKGMKSFDNEHWRTAAAYGKKPKTERQQTRLKMLAGPHGSAIAKAIANVNRLDISKWKYWP